MPRSHPAAGLVVGTILATLAVVMLFGSAAPALKLLALPVIVLGGYLVWQATR